MSDPYSRSCLKNTTHRISLLRKEPVTTFRIMYIEASLFKSVLTYSGTLNLDLADASSISGRLSSARQVAKWFLMENRTAPLNRLIAAWELSDSLPATTPIDSEIKVTHHKRSHCTSTGHPLFHIKRSRRLI